jgi:hypothetical protein
MGAADDLMGDVAGQPPLVTVPAAGARIIRIRRTAKTRYRCLSIGAGDGIGPRRLEAVEIQQRLARWT